MLGRNVRLQGTWWPPQPCSLYLNQRYERWRKGSHQIINPLLLFSRFWLRCVLYFLIFIYILPTAQLLWRQTGARKLHCRNLKVAVEWSAFLHRIYEFQVRISYVLNAFHQYHQKRCCAILQNRQVIFTPFTDTHTQYLSYTTKTAEIHYITK